MKEITINCCAFLSRSDLHRVLADALAFPDHYGSNLDALHDCLTEIAEETIISLANWKDAEEKLGTYAHSARRTILDAANENTNLAIIFD